MPDTFTPPLAFAENYPAPRMSMVPSESGSQEFGNRPAIEHVAHVIHMGLARNALGLIAKSELGPGSTVWLPAYHCPAMVEPFIWAGCDIAYYSMNDDLTPQLDMLPTTPKKPAACVLVRYFGFDCAIADSAAQLRSAGYLVIEDLAHSAHSPSLYGDYGVTSLRKFYPLSSGAELLISGRLDTSACERIKRITNQRIDSQLAWKAHKLRSRLAIRFMGENTNQYRYFSANELGQPMESSDARELSRHDHAGIAQKRRTIFQALAAALSDATSCTPFFKELSLEESPYVFPLLVSNADTFDYLRQAEIPLYRWEELASEDCERSKHWRTHLVQLPCHQDLAPGDIDYIVKVCRTLDSRG